MKAWTGSFALSFSETATGTVPGTGGSRTIALRRDAVKVPLILHRLALRPGPVSSRVAVWTDQVVRGGTVELDDSYRETGATAADPVLTGSLRGTQAPTSVNALLGVVPLTCTYKLLVGFQAKGTYSGDPSITPGLSVSGGAISHLEHYSPSLKLGGHVDTLDAQQTGCLNADVTQMFTDNGCYGFSGGWTNDFATLMSCHSVVAVGCGAPDAPMGEARLSWHLAPVFK